MKEFKVVVTTTLKETFIVRAEDADEAALIAKNDVSNAIEYTLNYDESEGEYVGGESWFEMEAVELEPEKKEYPKEPTEGTALAILLNKIRTQKNLDKVRKSYRWIFYINMGEMAGVRLLFNSSIPSGFHY